MVLCGRCRFPTLLIANMKVFPLRPLPFPVSAAVTCHNHSTWSDGENSLRGMALAAREAQAGYFGISDHLVLSPYGECSWSVAPEQFCRYREEAYALKRELQSEGFRILVGVEADYFRETWADLQALLERFPLDYVIGAVHYVGSFPVDSSAENWRGLDEKGQYAVWQGYIAKMRELARAGGCSFIAHLDLPKKYGYPMPAPLAGEMAECLREIAAAGIPVELNTAGLDKPCGEFYPAPGLLRQAQELGIPVVLSADAHCTRDIVRHFKDARRLLHGSA